MYIYIYIERERETNVHIYIYTYTHTHKQTYIHTPTHTNIFYTRTHLQRRRQSLFVALEVLNLLVEHLALSEGGIELLLERPDLIIELRLRFLELVLCLLSLLSEA